MRYHSYQHVERYNREEYTSFVGAKDIYVFPKLDGTAGVVTSENGEICCGSRNRSVSIGDDNQGFAAWVLSDDVEASALREFCLENPFLHVHGEWLGSKKFIGSIKDYVKSGFWVYDVYDEAEGVYLHYNVYSSLLDRCGIQNVIPPIAVLPAYDSDGFARLANENHFLLPSNIVGEGVVLKSYDWRDSFGRQQFFKLVLDEYKENKGKKKARPEVGEIETAIVEDFITSADIDKAHNKCLIACGENAPLHKIVGMTINAVIDDFLREEMTEVVRKYRFPKIDFSAIKALAAAKVRKNLGL